MNKIQKNKQNSSSVVGESKQDSEGFIEWSFQMNEKTGQLEFESIKLSDGAPLTEANFKNAVKRASGSSDPIIGERIIKKVARGLSADEFDQRINQASAMLPALNPENATEALLLGQFLALQDSGMKCLRQANSQDMFYHIEKLFTPHSAPFSAKPK